MALGWHITEAKWVQSDDHSDSAAAFHHLIEHINDELPGWQPFGNPVLEVIGGDRVYAQMMVKWNWGFF